jgi:hypothetical protein
MLSLSKIVAFNKIRVSAYAKKHLEVGREYREKLPKNAHRAFLMAVEAEQFLNDLE